MTALRVRGWLAWRLRWLADEILPRRQVPPVERTYRAQLVVRLDDRSPLARKVDRTWLPMQTNQGRPMREIVLPYTGPTVRPVALGSAIAGAVDVEDLLAPMQFHSMRFVLVAGTFDEQTGEITAATYRAATKFPDVGA